VAEAAKLGRVAAVRPPARLLDGAEARRAVGDLLPHLVGHVAPLAVAADGREVRELRIPLGVRGAVGDAPRADVLHLGPTVDRPAVDEPPRLAAALADGGGVLDGTRGQRAGVILEPRQIGDFRHRACPPGRETGAETALRRLGGLW